MGQKGPDGGLFGGGGGLRAWAGARSQWPTCTLGVWARGGLRPGADKSVSQAWACPGGGAQRDFIPPQTILRETNTGPPEGTRPRHPKGAGDWGGDHFTLTRGGGAKKKFWMVGGNLLWEGAASGGGGDRAGGGCTLVVPPPLRGGGPPPPRYGRPGRGAGGGGAPLGAFPGMYGFFRSIGVGGRGGRTLHENKAGKKKRVEPGRRGNRKQPPMGLFRKHLLGGGGSGS